MSFKAASFQLIACLIWESHSGVFACWLLERWGVILTKWTVYAWLLCCIMELEDDQSVDIVFHLFVRLWTRARDIWRMESWRMERFVLGDGCWNIWERLENLRVVQWMDGVLEGVSQIIERVNCLFVWGMFRIWIAYNEVPSFIPSVWGVAEAWIHKIVGYICTWAF